MAHNPTNPYDIDAHIAEVYDQVETETSDIRLIRQLLNGSSGLQILEPFTGTGRILLPLALDGHTVVGIDQAHAMLTLAHKKVSRLPEEAQMRVILKEGDVIQEEWPDGFDLVILGSNCFYELATPEEQAACINKAYKALKPGGHVYIDNDHMEGELAPSWQVTGVPEKRGISGISTDGSRVESFAETVWFDAPQRLVRFRRWTEITPPHGEKRVQEFIQQKHPVSTAEVRAWLEQNGFTIEHLFGDRNQNPYSDTSPRAIFWARKA